MADRLTAARPQRVAGHWRAWPAPARVAVIYAAARLVTTMLFLLATTTAGPGTRFGPDATLGDFVVGWDATWYWFVAVNGYPAELPRTDDGLVAENGWAFMPLYAWLSRGLGVLLGGWGAGAVCVSLVAGYLSALVLYRMLRARLDVGAATWAVVFFSAGPLAALFQVGYAESLFLLWLLLSLWALERRRYGWLYLLIPLMGATRPGVLAFSLLLALYGVWRWTRRRTDPLPVREVAHIVALGLLAAAVGFAWQGIAALVTGEPDAYLSTELAWRRNWIADASGVFLPFEGFLTGATFWARIWGLGTGWGIALLIGLVAALALLLLFEPHVRRLGVPVRLWCASYLLYLLGVFFPQSSTFRLLLPLSPLWGAVALPRAWWWRWGVLALCLVGQWWWIFNMYGQARTFWQIP
ncbi:hypothetical protein [Microbacterium sp. GXF7504]